TIINGSGSDDLAFLPTIAGTYTIGLHVADLHNSSHAGTATATITVSDTSTSGGGSGGGGSGLVSGSGSTSSTSAASGLTNLQLASGATTLQVGQFEALTATFSDLNPTPLVTDTWTVTGPTGSTLTRYPVVVDGAGTDVFLFMPTAAGTYTVAVTVTDQST